MSTDEYSEDVPDDEELYTSATSGMMTHTYPHNHHQQQQQQLRSGHMPASSSSSYHHGHPHSHHHPHSHQMGIGIQSSMMAQTNNDMINTNVGGGVIDQFDPQSEQIRQVSFACFKNHLIIFFFVFALV